MSRSLQRHHKPPCARLPSRYTPKTLVSNRLWIAAASWRANALADSRARSSVSNVIVFGPWLPPATADSTIGQHTRRSFFRLDASCFEKLAETVDFGIQSRLVGCRRPLIKGELDASHLHIALADGRIIEAGVQGAIERLDDCIRRALR